ncbi:MAG: hypothetical protein JWP64_1212 [Pseudonocardia sp.]|jgi:hypothetical protein|nr:hypothetical protein [Pseudonocardia sp.]
MHGKRRDANSPFWCGVDEWTIRRPSSAATVATPGVGRGELRAFVGPDQGGELDPQRFDQGCWQQGHGPSG